MTASTVIKLSAWIVTSLCAGVSVRSAVVFAKHQRRIYCILLLFALIWAMLIPYYSEQAPPDIILGFTGFLLWLIGYLVNEESGTPRSGPGNIVDQAAPWLFALMVVPSILLAAAAIGKFSSGGGNPWWLPTAAFATLISLLGYFSVCEAFWSYSKKNKRWVYALAVIVIFYSLVEIVFTGRRYYIRYYDLEQCSAASNAFLAPYCGGLNAWVLIGFAILKASLTFVFIRLILKRDVLVMEMKVLGSWERFFSLISVVQPGAPHVNKLKEAAKIPNERDDAINLLLKMARERIKVAEEALKELADGGLREAQEALKKLSEFAKAAGGA